MQLSGFGGFCGLGGFYLFGVCASFVCLFVLGLVLFGFLLVGWGGEGFFFPKTVVQA